MKVILNSIELVKKLLIFDIQKSSSSTLQASKLARSIDLKSKINSTLCYKDILEPLIR